MSVTGVSATSTNGGAVALSATVVTYTPATNFVGQDLFTFTVSDTQGGESTATVFVTVRSEHELSLNCIGEPAVTPDGVKVRFAGIPAYSYTVERSTDLTNWTALGAVTVPDGGIAEFTDTNPPASQTYYRTAQP